MFRHDPGAPSAAGTSVSALLGIDNVRLASAPGDYDLDFDVDGADFLAWQWQFGASGPFPIDGIDADGNHDGIVDSADYVIWQDHFGDTVMTASGVASVTVPEPNAVVLGVTLVLIVIFSRLITYSNRLFMPDHHSLRT